MITYKITLENGESQTTQTGKDLYCSILDKFNIKYKIEEINSNDIPHSDIRRMESEGVYEEKFQRNSSSPTYFNDEWNKSNNEVGLKSYMCNIDESHALDNVLNDMVKDSDIQDFEDDDAYEDGVDERPIKKDVEYNDDEFDY